MRPLTLPICGRLILILFLAVVPAACCVDGRSAGSRESMETKARYIESLYADFAAAEAESRDDTTALVAVMDELVDTTAERDREPLADALLDAVARHHEFRFFDARFLMDAAPFAQPRPRRDLIAALRDKLRHRDRVDWISKDQKELYCLVSVETIVEAVDYPGHNSLMARGGGLDWIACDRLIVWLDDNLHALRWDPQERRLVPPRR